MLTLSQGGFDYTPLNLGSVLGAKYKNWTLHAKLDTQRLAILDREMFEFYKKELHIEEKYSSDFFTALKAALPLEASYDSFDGSALKGLLKIKLIEGTKNCDEARAFLIEILTNILTTIEYKGDIAGLIKSRTEKIKDGKTFLKIPGQVLCDDLKIGSPTGGFNIAHVADEDVANLIPDRVYQRVAAFAKRSASQFVMLSEALVSDWANCQFGHFDLSKNRFADWNSWKGPVLGAQPVGYKVVNKKTDLEEIVSANDLGVLYPCQEAVLIPFAPNPKTSHIIVKHKGLNFVNIHLSGDGPIKGAEERAGLLEDLAALNAIPSVAEGGAPRLPAAMNTATADQ